MSARIATAKRKAVDLLRRARVGRAPVPVEKLAELLGASVRYEPFSGQLSGMVHRNTDGTAVIGVNSIHAQTRRRFTVAHEIGHLVLHDDASLHVDERSPIALRDHTSSMAIDEKEIEANQFAAELLMPRAFLVKDLKSLPQSLGVDEAIKRLSERYDVSVQAMTIRLTSLGVLT